VRDLDLERLMRNNHEYFHERNMRQAEKQFGHATLRSIDAEHEEHESRRTTVNGRGAAAPSELGGRPPDGLLSPQPTLDELRDELNIQRTLMNRIISRLESGALFRARTDKQSLERQPSVERQASRTPRVKSRTKSPERPRSLSAEREVSDSGQPVISPGAMNGHHEKSPPRSTPPSPAGINPSSPQSSKRPILRNKKLEKVFRNAPGPTHAATAPPGEAAPLPGTPNDEARTRSLF
jgi:hypothetical protein